MGHRSTMTCNGDVSTSWNNDPRERGYQVGTSRCWEMASLGDEANPCFIANQEQISNSVWPFLSISSSRMALSSDLRAP